MCDNNVFPMLSKARVRWVAMESEGFISDWARLGDCFHTCSFWVLLCKLRVQSYVYIYTYTYIYHHIPVSYTHYTCVERERECWITGLNSYWTQRCKVGINAWRYVVRTALRTWYLVGTKGYQGCTGYLGELPERRTEEIHRVRGKARGTLKNVLWRRKFKFCYISKLILNWECALN